MPKTSSISTLNLLLARISQKEYQRFLENCDLVELKVANVLSTHGDDIQYVYFPSSSVISLFMPINGASDLEVGLIGNEGMLGITLMLGISAAPFNAVVQRAGTALRIAAPHFLREIEQYRALHVELKRYLYVLISQLVQTASCYRFHVVEARLARLLLMLRDRTHSGEIHITQELLAQMLGVRRVGVTKAAGSLQKKRLISYSRGHVLILDAQGLEAESCYCYQADKEIYRRILTA
ncbi:hypothetical protein MTYP_00327 [Methylophilaceae bacterium]|nr:hypothetical protein MTYP_00327 [Methylophilaceae bacterium]